MVCCYTSFSCFEHSPPSDHPESIARLAVLIDLISNEFPDLSIKDCPDVAEASLCLVHDKSYLDNLKSLKVTEQSAISLDTDTYFAHGSLDAALGAAGAVCSAVDDVVSGNELRAFCPIRPPGHHAEKDRAMGFCLFNNIMIAAEHALTYPDISKVCVLDFDVHHGNGSEQHALTNSNILYVSSQQEGIFPNSHYVKQKNILDYDLPDQATSEPYKKWLMEVAFPKIEAFNLDLLLISAGFDAHYKDPLASLIWTDRDYYWITEQLCHLAEKTCQGRLISVLEGGYDLEALTASVKQHLTSLINT